MSKIDVFERIKHHFETLIEKKAYLPGEFLPSVRKVSIDLGVNPNTVLKAYQMLEKEKYIELIPKKGALILEQNQKRKTIMTQVKSLLIALQLDHSDDEILLMVHKILKEKDHD